MENVLPIFLLLFVIVVVPGWIFYSNFRYRNRLKETDLLSTGSFSNTYASLDASRHATLKYPRLFCSVGIFFGFFAIYVGLPLIGAAFILLFGTLFVGFLFGFVPKPQFSSTDTVVTSAKSFNKEMQQLAKTQEKRVSKGWLITLYTISFVALGLIVTNFLFIKDLSTHALNFGIFWLF